MPSLSHFAKRFRVMSEIQKYAVINTKILKNVENFRSGGKKRQDWYNGGIFSVSSPATSNIEISVRTPSH